MGIVTNNILGQLNYNIYIYDHQWDDWSASGWVYVDSTEFFSPGDFITIKYKKGVLGYKIIPKNQMK